MPNLSYRLNQALGRLLTGSGLIWLLLVILVGISATIVLRPGDAYIPLAKADFTIATPNLDGVVLYSDPNAHLLLKGNQLWWQADDNKVMVSDRFINILSAQGGLWVKTETHLGVLDLATGSLERKDIYRGSSFSKARLVAVDSRGYHLYHQGQVSIYNEAGTHSDPYLLAGNHTLGWLVDDWLKGVLFYHSNGWYLYQDYSLKLAYNGLSNRILTEAISSPDGKTVLYVIDEGGQNQLWSARVNGQHASQLAALPARFSSLEAIWSPGGQQVALALVGYTGNPLEGDEVFHGISLLYEPASGNLLILEELNSMAMTLPIPSAWAQNSRSIYSYRPDAEYKRPLVYNLVPR